MSARDMQVILPGATLGVLGFARDNAAARIRGS